MVGCLWSGRLLYYEEDMPLQAVNGHIKLQQQLLNGSDPSGTNYLNSHSRTKGSLVAIQCTYKKNL